MSAERLRLLYLVPGHHLLPTAGPTRNVLSLAAELGRRAELTLVFRRVLGRPPEDAPYRVEELDPAPNDATRTTGATKAAGTTGAAPVDDAAVRGASRRELLAYLRKADAWVDRRAPEFDVVLEKSWLLSGRLAARSVRRGTPAALIENLVRTLPRAETSLVRRAQHRVIQALVARAVCRVPLVVAETDELRRAILARWDVAPERVKVVGLGVDRERFRPRGRDEARRALGDAARLGPGATVLLYAGVLDRTHDLAPLLEALAGLAPGAAAGLELHVLGDGERRAEYEALAARAVLPVRFHGRVPHDAVPRWIAAADLCVAPYDRSAFPGGEVAYSTLKVPEFLACGRPVATVPSGNLRALVRDGESGFLLENEAREWARLLAGLDRGRLHALGEAAARSPAARRGWDDVAAEVLALCAELARQP